MDKDCSTCFFGAIKSSPNAPCSRCSDFDKYARDSIYFWNEQKGAVQPPETPNDPVNKPRHYILFPEEGLETRDVINRLLEKMEDCVGYEFFAQDYADYVQAMQYFMRFMDKNGKEDLEKGVWYMNKIIESWEKDEPTDV